MSGFADPLEAGQASPLPAPAAAREPAKGDRNASAGAYRRLSPLHLAALPAAAADGSAGAPGGVPGDAWVDPVAIDGYTVTLTADDRAAEDRALAIDMDGRPLGLAVRGPAWLLHETGHGDTAEALWI
jgi:hypothetical protein